VWCLNDGDMVFVKVYKHFSKKILLHGKMRFFTNEKVFFEKKNSSLEFFSESSPQNSKKRDYRAKKYYAKKSSIT
jgi:hypothetical protein